MVFSVAARDLILQSNLFIANAFICVKNKTQHALDSRNSDVLQSDSSFLKSSRQFYFDCDVRVTLMFCFTHPFNEILRDTLTSELSLVGNGRNQERS